jgi:hypothetical protein
MCQVNFLVTKKRYRAETETFRTPRVSVLRQKNAGIVFGLFYFLITFAAVLTRHSVNQVCKPQVDNLQIMRQ